MPFFRRRSSSRKIAVQFADTHGGHKLGLLNPDTELPDEDEWGNPAIYTPELNAVQRSLWDWFLEDLDNVTRLADGSPIVAIHDGDLCQGSYYKEQLVSLRQADQILIAVANMQPVLALPNLTALQFIEGTKAHNFGEGTATILVANRLKVERRTIDIASCSHALFNVNGAPLDCAHHGPGPGIRNWTAGNQLRYYARSIMDDAFADGEEPPAAIVRAHHHLMRHETIRAHTKRGTFKTEAIILPAYCGLSEHARQSTRSEHRISSGMVAFEIEGGRIKETHTFWRMVDLRTRKAL